MVARWLPVSFVSLCLLCAGVSWAQEETTAPTLEVLPSINHAPSRLIEPGSTDITLLRFRLGAKNHPQGGITIKNVVLHHEGDDRDQILRYRLWRLSNTLSRVSLPSSDEIAFRNIDYFIPNGEWVEFGIDADFLQGENVSGVHHFALKSASDITVKREDFRIPVTEITGDFPFESNKIEIGVEEAEEEVPTECNLREDLVCGVDGKTYFNACIPFQKGIEVAAWSACDESIKTATPTSRLICGDHSNPICGADGQTYQNRCFMERAGTTQKHAGECFPEAFEGVSSFTQSRDLFTAKKQELLETRDMRDSAKDGLSETENILQKYSFSAQTRKELQEAINDFLLFTEIPSDQLALEQRIESLRLAAVVARVAAIKAQYDRGDIPFIDTPAGSWYFDAIVRMKGKGWIEGYTDRTDSGYRVFEPTEEVSKAEVTKLVFRGAGINETTGQLPDNVLAQDHWASAIVAEAEERGLSMWNFAPNPEKRATRAEVVRLILETYDFFPSRSSKEPYFPDIESESEDFAFLQAAYELELVTGYPDGTFRPKNPVSRAEAVVLLDRARGIFDAGDE